MTTQDYDIESAGEPAPVVDYTASRPIRPAAVFAVFALVVFILFIAVWQIAEWLADLVWMALQVTW